MFFGKIVQSFAHINLHLFVFLATLVVLVTSVPMAYLVALLFNEPYGAFIFVASIVVPGLMAPPIFYKMISMLNRLSQFQDKLNDAIEENKKKELMLYEQARFAFMGEMLSNISHQWRQPLNTINLAILAAKSEGIHHQISDERLNETFDLIEVNTHYLSNTVDDFKSFFQKKDTNVLRTLNNIIDEVQNVIAPILKYNSIILEIDNNITKDIYLASPISQVILNLIANSIDALKSVSQADKRVTIRCALSHDMLEIQCCDNGCGIDENIVKSIFDPYFTTKTKSQGTGIGLYMSKQIVEKMFEGLLVFSPESHPKLTCFKMRLHYHNQQSDGV